MSDEEIVQGIKNGNEQVLQYVYRECYPPLSRFVQSNSGTDFDARDVFQETIMILYDKIASDRYATERGFMPYLFGVGRFVWLKRLKKISADPVTYGRDVERIDETTLQNAEREQRMWRIYQSSLKQLGDACRKLLSEVVAGRSMRIIAEKMGYTENYARQKNFRCKQQLKEIIRQHPDYSEE